MLNDLVPVSFGSWLKQQRQAAGVTRDDLAERTACSSTTLEKIESGERRPSRQIALSLAAIFHVPADEHEAFVTFARAPSASPRAPVNPPAAPATVGRTTTAAPANGHATQPAPWRAAQLRHSNVPQALTSFIGRATEAAAVRALLLQPRVRLLTLVGPPGIGKTRLSLAVAGHAEVSAHFTDGVFLVELAPITSPRLVVPTIVRTLGLKEPGGPQATPAAVLLQYVQDKRLLLVLDNFEQVLDAAPDLLAVLTHSPWLKVLVTSREALHMQGERRFLVPPLQLPLLSGPLDPATLAHSAAVALFVERAGEVHPDFALTAENGADLAAVCVGLDGLPLALELAAARTGLLSLRQMRAALSSRLQLTSRGTRDLPARHQTLRVAIDWSYTLLDAEEQQVFRRLAAFVGGCTLEAIARVGQIAGPAGRDAQAAVESLLRKSLLQQREGADGEPRFGLLETIHEYAREQLAASGEAAALQQEHARYFMWLAEEAEPQLKGPQQVAWLDRLEEEYDNIRAALAWAGERAHGGDSVRPQARRLASSREAAEMALRTASALVRFWHMHSRLAEGSEALARALAVPEAVLHACSPASRAKALNSAGDLAWRQRDYPAARALLTAALRLGRAAGDTPSMVISLHGLGNVAWQQGDHAGGRALFEESLALQRELADTAGIAACLGNLGMVTAEQGDNPAARALYEESLILFQELGDKANIGSCLHNLGALAQAQGDYPSARALFQESLALERDLGNKGGIALSLTTLGDVATEQGDYAGARALHEESLALWQELGHKRGIALALHGLAEVTNEEGDTTAARALFQASLALRREIGEQGGIAYSLHGLAGVATEQGDYAGAHALFQESLMLFRETEITRGIALALNSLAGVATEQGEDVVARALHEESLALRLEIGDPKGTAASLAGLGGVAVGMGQAERGATLLGAVAGLLGRIGAVLDRASRLPYERAVAAARARLGEAAFAQAWQAGLAMSREQATAYARQAR